MFVNFFFTYKQIKQKLTLDKTFSKFSYNSKWNLLCTDRAWIEAHSYRKTFSSIHRLLTSWPALMWSASVTPRRTILFSRWHRPRINVSLFSFLQILPGIFKIVIKKHLSRLQAPSSQQHRDYKCFFAARHRGFSTLTDTCHFRRFPYGRRSQVTTSA